MSEYANLSSLYEKSQEALQLAQDRLDREGIKYPILAGGIPSAEYITLLDEYRRIEAQYYIEALRSNQRRSLPKEPQKPQRKWGHDYND